MSMRSAKNNRRKQRGREILFVQSLLFDLLVTRSVERLCISEWDSPEIYAAWCLINRSLSSAVLLILTLVMDWSCLRRWSCELAKASSALWSGWIKAIVFIWWRNLNRESEIRCLIFCSLWLFCFNLYRDHVALFSRLELSGANSILAEINFRFCL